MPSESRILYLFTRTPLHVGSGSSIGAIDLPIQRERHTGFPIIPGSSIKGVLADGYLTADKRSRTEAGRAIFGHEKPEDPSATSAGVSFGEGQLLLFPVRSAFGCFAWITCPLVLSRWQTANGKSAFEIRTLNTTEILGDGPTIGRVAVLEDSRGDVVSVVPKQVAEALQAPFARVAPNYAGLLLKHLAVVSNDLFSHLVDTCCEIADHVRISDETGTAEDQGLFSQENVPSESLFCARLTELRTDALKQLSVPRVIQVGADESTGLGFCDAQLMEG